VFQQVGFRQRGGQLDARLAFAIVEIHRDDELLAGDGLGGGEHGAAAIAEPVTRIGAGAPPGDTVGIGQA
jgi:hypothetical protein